MTNKYKILTRISWLLAALVVPVTGMAVENPQQNTDTFRPSPLAGSLLGTDTSQAQAPWQFHGGMWLNYNHMPVKITDAQSGAQVALVRRQITADVYGGIGIIPRLALGVKVPVFLQAAGDALPQELSLSQISGTSLGDIALAARGVIVDSRGQGLGLALVQEFGLPTASRRELTGDLGVTAATRLVGDWTRSQWRLALNIGYRLRKSVTLLGQEFGNELTYGAGASIPVYGEKIDALGTLTGATSAAAPFGNAQLTVLDAVGGARVHFGDWAVTAGAGGGLLTGIGTPAFRATLGVAWTPPAPGDETHSSVAFSCPNHPEIQQAERCLDSDGDGIIDLDDHCPTATGAAALAGCPDRDGDGVADAEDRCPTMKGPLATGGCPDADGDGVDDAQDKCVARRGPAATFGCPDSDGDGLLDFEDKCPDVKGNRGAGGCPTDRDGDGIPDVADKCPDAPGSAERNGCPDQRVSVTKEKIVIAEKVFFDLGDVAVNKQSFGLLAEIAVVVKKHPEIKQISIEGHTDNGGNPAENLALSEKRAQAVKKFLAGKGVAEKRMLVRGFGDTVPVADNATEPGRASNRRVEFRIIQRD